MPQSTSCPAHVACIELAGFAAAQGACCLFDKVPFAPMAFTRNRHNNVTLTFMPGGSPAEMAGTIRRWLDAGAGRVDAAVVVCDAFITIAGVKQDALIVEGRSYGGVAREIKIAVPYRAHHHPRGFAIYRPKFIVDSLDGQDVTAFRHAFFVGVSSHEAGRRVWDACADESE